MSDIERILFFVGRALVGLFLIFMGMNHFGNLEAMTMTVAEVGLPAPMVAVIISGVLLVLAGLSFILGFQPPIGVLAAALFFVPVTLIMHDFWTIQEPTARQEELFTFLRNVGLMGSFLLYLAIPRPWPLSLDRYIQKRRYGRTLAEEQEYESDYDYEEYEDDQEHS